MKEELVHHRTIVHQAACVENYDKVEFKCEECHFVASKNDTLKHHMAKHENKAKNKKEQKFICSKCNKIFGTKKHLSQHDPFGTTEVQM